MPHIEINNDQPGIVSLFVYNPSTSPALNQLAQLLLRGESSMKEYERELIASYVSYLNGCNFCFNSHAAATDALYGNELLTSEIGNVLHNDLVSQKMKSLLRVAAKVQQNGKAVTAEDIQSAKTEGATDKEIHDAVLIAAAFCMYNRYVDGLNTVSSVRRDDYKEMGQMLASRGYVQEEFA